MITNAMLDIIATYTVTMTCYNVDSLDSPHKECVKFRTLIAAKRFAATVAECVDVLNVDVMNNNTGEIMWYSMENGEIYEAKD